MTATQVSYWIVGAARAPGQSPAVAIDLHNDDGDLVGQTHTIGMGPHDRGKRARSLAVAYARKHGIPAKAVHYDSDSTEAFKDC